MGYQPSDSTPQEEPTRSGASQPARWGRGLRRGRKPQRFPDDHDASTGWVTAEVNVHCDECGAPVFWKPAHQGLACEHCGAVRRVERLPGQILERPLAEGHKLQALARDTDLGLATKNLRCDSCGARVVLVEREIAKHCAFCGSAHVLPDQAKRSAIQPESLIPLMLPKDQVAEIFADWLHGLWFRPNALKRLSVFDALGVYVPAWTFDAEAASQWTAEAGYYYYVTVTQTVMVNGKPQTITRQERRVRWEPAAGSREDRFDDLQVMASAGIDPQLARKLGDFDTRELVPYRPEYLVGWEAEEYAIDLDGGWERGEARMFEEQELRCSQDVPGDTQRNLVVHTQLSDVRWKHVLLPLWSLSYSFRGEPYPVLINGQNGRIVGRAPYSWVKILFAVIVVLLLIGAIALFTQGS